MSLSIQPMTEVLGKNPPLRTPTFQEVMTIDYKNEPSSMQERINQRARAYIEANEPKNSRKASYLRPSDIIKERAAARRQEGGGILPGPDLNLGLGGQVYKKV